MDFSVFVFRLSSPFSFSNLCNPFTIRVIAKFVRSQIRILC